MGGCTSGIINVSGLEVVRSVYFVFMNTLRVCFSIPPNLFFLSSIRLAGFVGLAYKFVMFAEHLSARSVASWQAANPLINFAASDAG